MEVSIPRFKIIFRIGEKLKYTVKDIFPGAGSYNVPSRIQEGPQYSMPLSKKLLYSINKNPGPLEYDPSKQLVLKQFPSYSMRGKYENIFISNSPGPGKYYPPVDSRNISYK